MQIAHFNIEFPQFIKTHSLCVDKHANPMARDLTVCKILSSAQWIRSHLQNGDVCMILFIMSIIPQSIEIPLHCITFPIRKTKDTAKES